MDHGVYLSEFSSNSLFQVYKVPSEKALFFCESTHLSHGKVNEKWFKNTQRLADWAKEYISECVEKFTSSVMQSTCGALSPLGYLDMISIQVSR